MTEPSNPYSPSGPGSSTASGGAQSPYPSRRTLGGSIGSSQGQPSSDGADRFLPPTEPTSQPSIPQSSASSEPPTQPNFEPSRGPAIQVSSQGEATLPGQFEPKQPVSPGIPQRTVAPSSRQAAFGAHTQQGIPNGYVSPVA